MKTVVVFGATGFTGRLVVSELLALGKVSVILAGRDRKKLEALSAAHGGLPMRVADATRPETLGPLCEGAHAIVDTAGPFLQFGEPVVRAALDAGAHFLDTTGEQAYIARVVRRFSDEAKDRGLSVVNAAAFEFALGCCAAALLAQSDASVDTIDVFNRVSGMGATRGTMKSAIGALSEPALVLLDGEVTRRRFDPKPKEVRMPGAAKAELAAPFPGSEALFLHKAYPQLRSVTTNLVLPAGLAMASMAAFSAQPAIRFLNHAGLLGPLVRRIDKGPEGPGDEERKSQHFKVLARGRAPHAEKNVLVTGVDPYGITGVVAALGATLIVEEGPRATGVVSPDQAFGAKAFLEQLKPYGVRVQWS